jgi:hypothetical protein
VFSITPASEDASETEDNSMPENRNKVIMENIDLFKNLFDINNTLLIITVLPSFRKTIFSMCVRREMEVKHFRNKC